MRDKTSKSDQRQVDTGGGAYVGGNVDTGGGDFICRDQNVEAQQGVSTEEFTRLLAELRLLLPRAGLDAGVAEVVDADFRVVEEQAAKEKPNGAIILTKLEGAAKMLTALSGAAVAAEKLLPMAQKAIEWAGHLCR